MAAATQLIQADFADPELDAQRISQRQHLDAGLLDTAFLHCRGRRCSDEIAMTRASKLFKLLSDHPQGNPEHAARRCGSGASATPGRPSRSSWASS